MVRALCGTVILLDAGRIAAAGSVAEVLDNAELLAKHGLA
jgi:ABC-type microcin C transport system duplicated ATPase subunit YejF